MLNVLKPIQVYDWIPEYEPLLAFDVKAVELAIARIGWIYGRYETNEFNNFRGTVTGRFSYGVAPVAQWPRGRII